MKIKKNKFFDNMYKYLKIFTGKKKKTKIWRNGSFYLLKFLIKFEYKEKFFKFKQCKLITKNSFKFFF